MKYLVQTRETSKEPWRNDSGYDMKSQAHGRMRLLRRIGSMEAKVIEVDKLPDGLPSYDNCKTLKALQKIRLMCAWGDDSTYSETHPDSVDN